VYNIAIPGDDKRSGEIYGSTLCRTKSYGELAAILGIPEQELAYRLGDIKKALFTARESRSKPAVDDKVLADWNGLFIAALAQAAWVFDSKVYRDAAVQAMDRLLLRVGRAEGGLFHRYRDGEAAIPAFADDYAYLTLACLRLYRATFDRKYIGRATVMSRYLSDHFSDSPGGLYTAEETSAGLLVRKKEIYDGAMPSANSVFFGTLLELSLLVQYPELEEQAWKCARAFAGDVAQSPSSHAWYLCALDMALGPSQRVEISGPSESPIVLEMIRVLQERYLPSTVIIFKGCGESTKILETCIRNAGNDGLVTAAVCTGHTCAIPALTAEELAVQLEGKGEDTKDR
jgi:uncharacterized protein YyaL (SSP411 family)